MLLAAIFDLDGLLIDSEPWWRRAQVEIFARTGLHLREEDCAETTGLRIDEVVAYRHAQHPWQTPSQAVVTTQIVDRVIELIATHAQPKPGGREAIELCAQHDLRLAVASSSPVRLIETVLARLGVTDRFAQVVSAEHERYGKPHPAVFLTTAERLGVAPTECLVFEDSLPGVIAAKAARMRCIAVPERADPRFVLADRVLGSLTEFDAVALAGLAGEH